MGVTILPLSITNPRNNSKYTHLKFILDSGAVYSAVPQNILKELGIKPIRRERLILIDGSILERDLGEAVFQYKDRKGTAPVIFGENKDQTILGITALEVMGLGLNSLTRTIIKLQPTF